ncbi:TetR/AcrR family transcriptional regulator [Streptomyces acidiscabies]|uniref:TetR/AcrR family transcriptional regulator n=1 Tax=Streptomyces acidiscabies TaxID=42234 RepID=A0AAP6B943_9ACTN|nr:TetR/AcrR family transcriptional regulator [Streptomyces acidiscabies]MBP5936018.1 TetR/AcrR family transcriptional regulator [Streptomyces sp. LBUM 1476]MBZ3916059.1 TetR/AcrR family transcriptional regulator [Streptomyces acidiscabies]MDX2960450.1 TetR/AcrR family transcriptional regulator [Streptomyces acidiscabies]MDX3017736.1 TetR/AcrR family transcriptional regulator [Streptomyces acidiscabies]MDX3794335.1 TetR/AcrR family transcriptional regulator [Streptomyces acidiscabies]
MSNTKPEAPLKAEEATTRRTRARRAAPHVRSEQILDAAVEVLLERGLPATTMDQIARTAGIGKGTMYLYFESKTQILAALRTRWVERALVSCNSAALYGRQVSTLTRVERFIEALFDATAADRLLLGILFREAGLEDHNEISLVRDDLLRHVREGIRSGDLEVRDPEIVVSFLLHGVYGVFVEALTSGDANHKQLLSAVRRIIRLQLGRQE